ncbi:MAG: hypothetical protein IJX17_02305 [Clostridia bacterium]|nr:hypothetical protein [Clostridia bacterium]
MGLSLIDYIIIISLVIISILICYFYFWKNRNKPCHGCPYAKNCTNGACKSKNNFSQNNEENNKINNTNKLETSKNNKTQND